MQSLPAHNNKTVSSSSRTFLPKMHHSSSRPRRAFAVPSWNCHLSDGAHRFGSIFILRPALFSSVQGGKVEGPFDPKVRRGSWVRNPDGGEAFREGEATGPVRE